MNLTSKTDDIAKILTERGETVAVAESSGGGLLSASLLAVPGASRYYVGGGVIYTQQAREQITGIDFSKLDNIRSSSEPYASLLAKTMRELLGTTWGVAETGASGPTGNRYGDDAQWAEDMALLLDTQAARSAVVQARAHHHLPDRLARNHRFAHRSRRRIVGHHLLLRTLA